MYDSLQDFLSAISNNKATKNKCCFAIIDPSCISQRHATDLFIRCNSDLLREFRGFFVTKSRSFLRIDGSHGKIIELDFRIIGTGDPHTILSTEFINSFIEMATQVNGISIPSPVMLFNYFVYLSSNGMQLQKWQIEFIRIHSSKIVGALGR